MADGALSLLAMPAAGLLAGGARAAARRDRARRAAALLPRRTMRDGWVSMGALEPKFWAAFCRGVGREDLVAHQFDAPGLARARARSRQSARRGRAPSGRRSTPSTTAAWSRCWNSTRRSRTSTCGRGAWSSTGCWQPGAAARDARRSRARRAARAGRAHGRGARRGRLRRGGDRARCARRARGEVSDAFFVPLGDGRYRATERTSGPWDPRHQHAGPPSALLTGLLERTAPREDMVLARVTVEILGAVPIAEVEVETSVERPGRSVELLAGELRADGRPVLRARAWRVLGSPVGTDGRAAPVALPEAPSRRRRRSARRSATRTRSSGGGRSAAGRSAGRRRSGRGCGSRSSRARSRRRASA